MLALAGRVGRRTAHRMVHEATMQGAAEGRPVRDAVLDAPAIVEALGIDALTAILDAPPDTGRCGEMVDRVLGDAS
jgi:adenylosuccinate lyase